MAEPVLWPLEDHTRAKHRVLRSYLNGWIPVMGHQSLKAYDSDRTLLLVDGFAGPGRYLEGAAGSPLIMLDALLSHAAFPNLTGVRFLLLFIEQNRDRVARLRTEVANLRLPDNVKVFIKEGRFEEEFGEVVDGIRAGGKRLPPTFAFIDPFGYSSASMSITGRLLDFPRSEALFFLPLSFISRFVGRDGQEAALNSLFESDEWRSAIPLRGLERRQYLLDLFERQLQAQGQVRHVRSFELHTADGNDYRLVFATQHEKGLGVMKEAMWSVDPVQGTRYSARTETGQEVLFTLEVDTAPLLEELRCALGSQWFTMAQAEEVTLLRTPYLPHRHLKSRTLAPAERAGALEVSRPEGKRKGTFTDDVRMLFREQ